MIKNGIVNLIGQFLKLASSVLLMPLLLNYLGINLFGLFSWVTAILAGVQLVEGGLSSGLLYFLSKKSSEEDNEDLTFNKIVTSGILLLGISTSLVLILLTCGAPLIIETLNGISPDQKNQLQIALIAGAILVGIRIMQSFFWALIQSQQRYKLYSAVSTIQIVLTNVGWLCLAYIGEKYLPNFIFLSIVLSVSITLWVYYLTKEFYVSFKWTLSKSTTYTILKYNSAVWGSHLGSILFSQGDKLVVANTLGADVLGVYTIFTSITSQINQFSAQVTHPIVPLVSSASRNLMKNIPGIKIPIKQFFLLNIYIALGGAGLLIILAEPILLFFLHSNFLPKLVFPFQTLCIVYGIYCLSVTGYYISLALGHSVKVMVVSVIGASISLISMYITSKTFDLLGVTLSNGFFFIILVLLFDSMKEMQIKTIDWIKLLLPPLLATVTAALISMLHSYNWTFLILLAIAFILTMGFCFISQYLKFTNAVRVPILTLIKKTITL
jgi:O-antigen/teichoic acid export membrane protein